MSTMRTSSHAAPKTLWAGFTGITGYSCIRDSKRAVTKNMELQLQVIRALNPEPGGG